MNRILQSRLLIVSILFSQFSFQSISQVSEILSSTTWYKYDRNFEQYIGIEKTVYKKGKMLKYFADYDSAYIKKLGEIEMLGGRMIGLDTIVEVDVLINDSTITTPIIEYDIDRSLLPEYVCDYIVSDSAETVLYDIFNFDNTYALVTYGPDPFKNDIWLKFYYTNDTLPPFQSTNNYKFHDFVFKGYTILDTIVPGEWTLIETNCLQKNNPTGRYPLTGNVIVYQYKNNKDTNLIAYVVNNKYPLGYKYIYNNDVSYDTTYRTLVKELNQFISSDLEVWRNSKVEDRKYGSYMDDIPILIKLENSYSLHIYNIISDKPIQIELTNKLWSEILTAYFWEQECKYEYLDILDRY